MQSIMNKGLAWPTLKVNTARFNSNDPTYLKPIELQPISNNLLLESISQGLPWSAVMVSTMRVKCSNPLYWKSIGLQPTSTTPLFDTSEMEYFGNEKSKKILEMEGTPRRVALCVPLRYKNINDHLERFDPKITPQVVILGSGFDVRSLTYKEKGFTFYEVDSPEVLNIKKAIYAANNKDKNAAYIPMDYINEDLLTGLEQNGLKFNLNTYFIWEGNSMYTKKWQQLWHKILEKFTGSVSISMDYCSKETVTQTTGLEENTNAVDIFKKLGADISVGFNHIQNEFANPLGLSVVKNSSGAELAQGYGVSSVLVPELEHAHVAHFVRE